MNGPVPVYGERTCCTVRPTQRYSNSAGRWRVPAPGELVRQLRDGRGIGFAASISGGRARDEEMRIHYHYSSGTHCFHAPLADV